MPASSFPEYAQALNVILNALLAAGQARLINLDVDQRSLLRGFIAGIVRFDNDSELHLREFVDMTLAEPRLMYAYHYLDSEQSLILRYDNAPHRPALGQAEHKHTPAGATVSAAGGCKLRAWRV